MNTHYEIAKAAFEAARKVSKHYLDPAYPAFDDYWKTAQPEKEIKPVSLELLPIFYRAVNDYVEKGLVNPDDERHQLIARYHKALTALEAQLNKER